MTEPKLMSNTERSVEKDLKIIDLSSGQQPKDHCSCHVALLHVFTLFPTRAWTRSDPSLLDAYIFINF